MPLGFSSELYLVEHSNYMYFSKLHSEDERLGGGPLSVNQRQRDLTVAFEINWQEMPRQFLPDQGSEVNSSY